MNEILPEIIFTEVTNIATRMKMNHLEAMLFFCDKNEYDIETLSSIVPQSLKTLMEEDARSLRLLKKEYSNNTLPL
jgi:hypothetical protein